MTALQSQHVGPHHNHVDCYGTVTNITIIYNDGSHPTWNEMQFQHYK